MWVHSQLCSEVKEKGEKKKRQYVLHYVPVLAGISQKCKRLKLYLHTSSSNSRHCSNIVIVVEGDLSHNLPALFNFINSSQREHSHPSTNYFHILPRFPSALRSRELIERKKKKSRCSSGSCVFSRPVLT